MNYQNKNRLIGNIVLTIGILFGVAKLIGVLTGQMAGLGANEVGLLSLVGIRNSLMVAYLVLFVASSFWFASGFYNGMKSGLVTVVLSAAFSVITMVTFSIHMDSTDYRENVTVRSAEIKRVGLIQLASWVKPELRSEMIIEYLFADNEVLDTRWAELGHDRQLDSLINLQTKGVVPFSIKDAWVLDNAGGDSSIDLEDFYTNGVAYKGKSQFDQMVLTITQDARVNMILALAGLVLTAVLATIALLSNFGHEGFRFLVLLQVFILPASLFVPFI